jgi:hypothetical protein
MYYSETTRPEPETRTMRVITLHEHDETRAAEVMGDMQTLGAPTIRVIDCGDHYQAIEGTHRLVAAARLGLPVNLDIIGPTDSVNAGSLDWGTWDRDEQPSGAELASEAYRHGWRTAHTLEIDAEGCLELLEPR